MSEAKYNVLVLGKTPEIMPRVLDALREAGFHPVGVFEESDAHAHLTEGGIGIVAIGGGVSAAERQSLKSWIARHIPQIKVVDVFNPSTLVETVNRAIRHPDSEPKG